MTPAPFLAALAGACAAAGMVELAALAAARRRVGRARGVRAVAALARLGGGWGRRCRPGT